MARVAVVTGSNKGIGFAIVRGLCKQFEGDVYLTARDVGRGEAAVAELKKEGLSPKFHQLDIDDEASVKTLAAFLKETYGGVDVFVNNAGIAFKQAATEPFGEQAEVTLRTNFFNTLRVCKNILPITKSGARVVHLSSMTAPMAFNKCSQALKEKIVGIQSLDEIVKLMTSFVQSAKAGNHQADGWPNSACGVSKLGVCMFTAIQQSKIGNVKEDVVINSCCPGHVDTDMSSHMGPKTIDEGADTPLYLALLPPKVESPRGEFVTDRKIAQWAKI